MSKNYDIPAEQPAVELVTNPWGSFKQYAHNHPVTVSLVTVTLGMGFSVQSYTIRVGLNCVLIGFCATILALSPSS